MILELPNNLVVYVNKHSMNTINAVQSIPTASDMFEYIFVTLD